MLLEPQQATTRARKKGEKGRVRKGKKADFKLLREGGWGRKGEGKPTGDGEAKWSREGTSDSAKEALLDLFCGGKRSRRRF